MNRHRGPAAPGHGLAADEVDVWTVPLPLPPQIEAALQETLSPDELHRAARFAMPAPRRQFVGSRGVLRHLLGQYLDLAPQHVRLVAGRHGKPALADHPALSFNLSHTDGLLLVAIAAGMDVGVDVEKVRPMEGAAGLAARYFPAAEGDGIAGDPTAFLRLWTCRESAVKACGRGISHAWDALRIVERSADQAEAFGLGSACRIRLLSPGPAYVAAVAAMAREFRIRRLRTPDLATH